MGGDMGAASMHLMRASRGRLIVHGYLRVARSSFASENER